ncbi:hypothetical protein HQ571_01450 [Candidatus Kuenenbacteria bacterium]|nr:hypothetical protein [Candidatus Kuenenbacteria bacterium]
MKNGEKTLNGIVGLYKEFGPDLPVVTIQGVQVVRLPSTVTVLADMKDETVLQPLNQARIFHATDRQGQFFLLLTEDGAAKMASLIAEDRNTRGEVLTVADGYTKFVTYTVAMAAAAAAAKAKKAAAEAKSQAKAAATAKRLESYKLMDLIRFGQRDCVLLPSDEVAEIPLLKVKPLLGTMASFVRTKLEAVAEQYEADYSTAIAEAQKDKPFAHGGELVDWEREFRAQWADKNGKSAPTMWGMTVLLRNFDDYGEFAMIIRSDDKEAILGLTGSRLISMGEPMHWRLRKKYFFDPRAKAAEEARKLEAKLAREARAKESAEKLQTKVEAMKATGKNFHTCQGDTVWTPVESFVRMSMDDLVVCPVLGEMSEDDVLACMDEKFVDAYESALDQAQKAGPLGVKDYFSFEGKFRNEYAKSSGGATPGLADFVVVTRYFRREGVCCAVVHRDDLAAFKAIAGKGTNPNTRETYEVPLRDHSDPFWWMLRKEHFFDPLSQRKDQERQAEEEVVAVRKEQTFDQMGDLIGAERLKEMRASLASADEVIDDHKSAGRQKWDRRKNGGGKNRGKRG